MSALVKALVSAKRSALVHPICGDNLPGSGPQTETRWFRTNQAITDFMEFQTPVNIGEQSFIYREKRAVLTGTSAFGRIFEGDETSFGFRDEYTTARLISQNINNAGLFEDFSVGFNSDYDKIKNIEFIRNKSGTVSLFSLELDGVLSNTISFSGAKPIRILNIGSSGTRFVTELIEIEIAGVITHRYKIDDPTNPLQKNEITGLYDLLIVNGQPEDWTEAYKDVSNPANPVWRKVSDDTIFLEYAV
jgi:hypothetical protein